MIVHTIGMILPAWFILAQVAADIAKPTQIPAPAPTQQPTSVFMEPFVVAETQRLCVTPLIDGKLDDEEWDPLSKDTYFQWEPGKLHFAAKVAPGQDALLSVDLNGDGWLVGEDNIEVRASLRDGKPALSVRQLNARNVSGPVWNPLKGYELASRIDAASGPSATVYEVTLSDPGIGLLGFKSQQKIGVRIDAVPSSDTFDESYKPRALTPVQLVTTRSVALPAGVKTNVERNERPVVPGESTMYRVTFNGTPKTTLGPIEVRSEGLAKDQTNKLTSPFPGFDNKGRAYVDYVTKVGEKAPVGYRTLRTTVVGNDGISGVMEATYRIAPGVDLDLVKPVIAQSNMDRGFPIGFYIGSNAGVQVVGEVEIVVPELFRIMNGGQKHKFVINTRGSRIRKSFDLFIPAGTGGTYPITFNIKIKDKTISYERYLTFQ